MHVVVVVRLLGVLVVFIIGGVIVAVLKRGVVVLVGVPVRSVLPLAGEAALVMVRDVVVVVRVHGARVKMLRLFPVAFGSLGG